MIDTNEFVKCQCKSNVWNCYYSIREKILKKCNKFKQRFKMIRFKFDLLQHWWFSFISNFLYSENLNCNYHPIFIIINDLFMNQCCWLLLFNSFFCDLAFKSHVGTIWGGQVFVEWNKISQLAEGRRPSGRRPAGWL